jgi:c-di-AMP phosphodiesterase-like protein
MGKVVDQREFTVPVGAQTFDVTHYAPGVLLVQITTDKHERIVKRAQVIH